jgi:hypothetical protein
MRHKYEANVTTFHVMKECDDEKRAEKEATRRIEAE